MSEDKRCPQCGEPSAWGTNLCNKLACLLAEYDANEKRAKEAKAREKAAKAEARRLMREQAKGDPPKEAK